MIRRLTDMERQALDVLARVQYATQGQLQDWGIPQYNVSRMLPKLEQGGLIRVLRDYRPGIIHITQRGAEVVDRSLPSGKTFTSWPVMAHRCRRNHVELTLREQFPRFTFYSRKYAYARGLNPSRGEHGATDGEGRQYLIILDDYLMNPSRIVHSWTRRHSPNRDYYDEPLGLTWGDVAERLIVVTTDEVQLSRHNTILSKCQATREMLDAGDAPTVIRSRLGMKKLSSVEHYASVPADSSVLLSPPIWMVQ